MTDASGTSPSGMNLLQTAAGRVVDYVRVNERRRLAVIVGVSFLFWLLVELAANMGFLPLIVAVGLGAYLYIQETAQEMLAASAYGTGLLAVRDSKSPMLNSLRDSASRTNPQQEVVRPMRFRSNRVERIERRNGVELVVLTGEGEDEFEIRGRPVSPSYSPTTAFADGCNCSGLVEPDDTCHEEPSSRSLR